MSKSIVIERPTAVQQQQGRRAGQQPRPQQD
jgi:hypothetical protein